MRAKKSPTEAGLSDATGSETVSAFPLSRDLTKSNRVTQTLNRLRATRIVQRHWDTKLPRLLAKLVILTGRPDALTCCHLKPPTWGTLTLGGLPQVARDVKRG